MKSSKDMLTSILKTTQMGQIGIRSVLDTHVQPGMRSALESQLQEYDSIETQARDIASQRGWELDEVDPAIRAMANMTTRMRVPKKYPDSKIADMMIRGGDTDTERAANMLLEEFRSCKIGRITLERVE